MDQELKKAVEANRKAIILFIEICGPKNFEEIRQECYEQAFRESFGNEQSVKDALEVLVKQGALVEDNEDGVTVWDLPDQPWGDAA